MYRRVIFIFILIITVFGPATAQGRHDTLASFHPKNPYLQLIYHDGIFWSRTEYLKGAFEDGYRALEARFGFQTTGRYPWQQLHNYPRYGFGVHYADLVSDTEDTIVGNPFSAFVFYGAPWIRAGRFSFNSDLSLGLSYASLIHDPVRNPYNDVIASHMNLYFDFNLNVYWALTGRIDLNAGYGVTHYSNGGMHQPQKGVNCWGWNFGLSYHPIPRDGQLKGYDPSEKPEFRSREEIQIMYAAGTVENQDLGDPEGVRYFTSSFTVDYAVTFHPRMALTFGTDVLYDGSLERAIKGINPTDVSTFQKFYFGSHLGYHFLIDRVTILFNLGTYFLQHTYDRGAWFMRAGGRIRLTDHLHTQICIKTKNGVRSDWIEWGLAVSVPTRVTLPE
jgi:hypothetical protein